MKRYLPDFHGDITHAARLGESQPDPVIVEIADGKRQQAELRGAEILQVDRRIKLAGRRHLIIEGADGDGPENAVYRDSIALFGLVDRYRLVRVCVFYSKVRRHLRAAEEPTDRARFFVSSFSRLIALLAARGFGV